MEKKRGVASGRWVKAVSVVSVGAVGAALYGGIVAAKKHHLPTGPDAFLHYQVDSTDELVAALKESPVLRRRYARHFGIPEGRVVEFVKNALVPYRLPEARNVTVYGVTRAGRIYSVRERLRKGTKVWATRSGVPILKWACANPLTNKLPGTRLAMAPRPVRPHTSVPTPKSVPALVTLASSDIPAPEGELAPMPPLPPVDTTALAPPAPVAVGAALAPVPAVAASNSGGNGHSVGAILIPVGIILGTTLGHGSGGSGSNELPPPVTIPEPGTLALTLTAGIPILGIATWRRRRARGGSAE